MKIDEICESERNVSFKSITSIRTGGKVKFIAHPKTLEQLATLVSFLEDGKIKHYVLGNGTNVLPPDQKYNGVIIKLDKMSKIYRRKNVIFAYAGANLMDVITFSIYAGLGGLENGSGIPGTIGGGLKGNCGANGFEMADFVKHVWVLRDGKIKKLTKEQCGFEYRKSNFLPKDIIIKASFELKPQNKGRLIQTRNEILQKRKAFPPYPSMGSVFKRMDGIVVSKMLDQMGFKGKRCGKAMVSKQHAGIIINLGGAKSKNIKKLIKNIKKSVKKQKNIDLIEEIVHID